MGVTDKAVAEYIHKIQPLCDGVLGEIQRDAYRENVPIVPPEVAKLLSVLLAMKKPEFILEIGCAVGFSTGLMSRYLAEGGHITTIDRFDIMITQAKQNFKKLGIEDKVTLIEGDACDVLPTLEGRFDVIFLDAAKGQYIQMLPHCLRLLNVGGLLIADDVLQEGRTAMDRYAVPRRQRTIHTRMNEFLKEISTMDALESSMIPIGDGVVVAYKV